MYIVLKINQDGYRPIMNKNDDIYLFENNELDKYKNSKYLILDINDGIDYNYL